LHDEKRLGRKQAQEAAQVFHRRTMRLGTRDHGGAVREMQG
jgi:hypothetical protein